MMCIFLCLQRPREGHSPGLPAPDCPHRLPGTAAQAAAVPHEAGGGHVDLARQQGVRRKGSNCPCTPRYPSNSAPKCAGRTWTAHLLLSTQALWQFSRRSEQAFVHRIISLVTGKNSLEYFSMTEDYCLFPLALFRSTFFSTSEFWVALAGA